MNPNVYSLWSQTPLSLGYITKACSLIGQFTCTFQKLCLEMAFFKNFKYVFWRLQTRCLKLENCFGITGLILLKWDTVQHDPSLGEKVEFPLVTDLWPRWPNKHVVWPGVSEAGMVSRGQETVKRLLVSGLWGGARRPKETQGESLESWDYATQRDPTRISWVPRLRDCLVTHPPSLPGEGGVFRDSRVVSLGLF